MKNNSIKISVIIPCYNVEKYIESCLDSVIAQTFTNFEIICVDDGSMDQTQSLLQKYKVKCIENLHILTQQNKGQSSALNRGIEVATGEYLQFLDADDLLYKNKLEHQVQLIKNNGFKPDLIATAVEKRFEDGRVKIDKDIKYEPWEALARFHIGITSSNLWKKKAVDAVHGFDEDLPSNKEHDLIFRMLKKGATVLHDPEPLTIKRERSENSISSGFDHHHLARKIAHRHKIFQYTRDSKLLNDDLLQYLLTRNLQDLKRIYPADSKMALNLHQKYSPENFKISYGFSKSYQLLYNILGFKRAEMLRSKIGR